MNKRGFTLIELLAVIVILGIVTTIVLTMGTNIYNKAKNEEQQTFIDRLTISIGDFITMYSSSDKEYISVPIVTSCRIPKSLPEGGTTSQVLTHYTVPLKYLYEEAVVNKEIRNPKNKTLCYDNEEPLIHVFKDTDLVTYYYVNLSKCVDDEDVQIIRTLPNLIGEEDNLNLLEDCLNAS